MCEFCVKHGEGEKWYLRAQNYADDLVSDLRRREFIREFSEHPEALKDQDAQLQRLERLPGFVRSVIKWRATEHQKKVHYGQVVPMEDVERIFSFVNSVVRVGCICRYAFLGTEERYCYPISVVSDGGESMRLLGELDASYLRGPDTDEFDELSTDEALTSIREHEREGLCHTIWTFITPFIGVVCNCDRSDCHAMRTTLTYGMPVMFRAEYVGEVDPDLCNGCRACMRVCQYGALGYSAARRRALIEARRCYGCGICRSVCPTDAIALRERASVPTAAGLW